MTLIGYRPDRFFEGLRAIFKAAGLSSATVEYDPQHAEYKFRYGAHVRALGYWLLQEGYDNGTALTLVADIALDIKYTIALYEY